MKIKTLFVVLGMLLSLFVGSVMTAQAAPPKHHAHSAAWYRRHRHHSAAWYRRHGHHTVHHTTVHPKHKM